MDSGNNAVLEKHVVEQLVLQGMGGVCGAAVVAAKVLIG